MNTFSSPGASSIFNNLTPAQILMFQQQLQQQQQAAVNSQNFERHRQNMLQNKKTQNSFSSSFSVNSLLNSNLTVGNNNVNQNQQQNNQQLATAVLTRHIAQAVSNINMQQQLSRQQNRPFINDSAFQAPARKKQKSIDNSSQNIESSSNPDFLINHNPLNSSICSISSPSSSSSSASYSSSSLNSFDYTQNNPDSLYSHSSSSSSQNFSDNLKSIMSENNNQAGSSNSTSFNDSNEFLEGHNDSARSSPSLLNESTGNNKLKTPSSNVRRSNRKRIAADLQSPCCPICGLSLRMGDLQAHLNSELERLENVNSFCGNIAKLIRSEEVFNSSHSFKRTISGCEKSKSSSIQNETSQSNSRHLAYLKIKEKRQARIKNKLRLRMKENQVSQTHQCPLCNESISDSKDQINSHLQNCLMLKNNDISENNNNRDFNINNQSQSSGDQNIDTSDDHSNHDGSYETYEWAGQKRIRTITMLENPARGIDATNVKKEEFDGELNVDFDENVAFGKPQFNESDLIPIDSDGNKKNLLRQAVIDEETNENELENDVENKKMDKKSAEKKEEDKESFSIKRKLSEDENEETSRCLICMEGYTNALISVNCWHVHCKTCWFQSLGAKKLCPQCKVITTPKDLRRIFL